MTSRSPVRALAPTTLLTVMAAAGAIVVLSPSRDDAGASDPGAATVKPAGPRIYRVRRGDTLSTISIRTDVPLATLHRLNHAANQLALEPGQRIKLRPIRR